VVPKKRWRCHIPAENLVQGVVKTPSVLCLLLNISLWTDRLFLCCFVTVTRGIQRHMGIVVNTSGLTCTLTVSAAESLGENHFFFLRAQVLRGGRFRSSGALSGVVG
jgi:hypothetical protein